MPEITMPQLGETVTEGTITKWLKNVGDTVAVDELLFEVSTDKVDSEVPSSLAGTLTEIRVQEGETVPVGAVLAVIGDAAASPQPAQAAPAEAEVATAPEPAAIVAQETAPKQPASSPSAPQAPERAQAKPHAPAEVPDGAVLSPVVRRLAKENNIDLSKVKGTGQGGRITREDVLALVEGRGGSKPGPAPQPSKPKAEPAAPPPPSEAAPATAAQVAAEPAAAQPPAPAPTPVPPVLAAAASTTPTGARTEPLSTIRARIAEHMLSSLATSARAVNVVEVDMENVEKVRQAHRDGFRAREGFSLTYLPFIARSVVDALRTHPAVNASINLGERTITYHDYVNIGVAVDLDEKGLIVPVVKRADEMTVTGLARRTRELADKAHSRQLVPDDVVGSTFTITNPGPFGSVMSVPVINQPNVAILSTDAVEKRVVVVDDMIAIRHRMYLCMSWDHRAFDGSTAVRFLATLKENLETWDWEAQLG